MDNFPYGITYGITLIKETVWDNIGYIDGDWCYECCVIKKAIVLAFYGF